MIIYHEGKSSGGIRKAWIIRQDKATFDPSLAIRPDLTYTDTISVSESWIEIVPLPDSGSWSEQHRDGGYDAWSYQVELVINRDRQSITQSMSVLVPYKLLLLVEDYNGLIRLIGSDQHHVRLSYEQVKDDGIISPNLYRIRISGEQPFAAAYYTGSIT